MIIYVLLIILMIYNFKITSIYTQIAKKIELAENKFLSCIKYNIYNKCRNISIKLYKDKYDKEFCFRYNCPTFPKENSILNTKVLYKPVLKKKFDYLFVVQVGPSEIVSRMIFRNTINKYQKEFKKIISHIFFMGIPYNSKRRKNKDININLLIDEYFTFKDMIIFNFINSYFCITLQLFSMYKWIVESNLDIQKVIRVDTNAIVYENKLKKLLEKNIDLQAFPCYTKIPNYNKSIKYPQGSFHILSIQLIKLLIQYYNKSVIVKSNDKTTGLIIHRILQDNIKLNINWFNDTEVDLLIHFHNHVININEKTIALHPLTLSAIHYYLNYKI